MAIQRRAGQTAQWVLQASGTTAVATLPQSVVVGDVIAVFCKGSNIAAGTYPDDATVTDNLGNTYTPDVTNFTVDEHRVWVFSCKKVTVGGSCTITFSSAGDGTGARLIGAMEYEGFGSAGAALDKTASNKGTGTAASSGVTATRTVADELGFGGVGIGDSFTQTPGGSWSELGDNTASGERAQFGDQIFASTGTDAYLTTVSSSALWTAVVATYKSVEVFPPTQRSRGFITQQMVDDDDGRFDDLDVRNWFRGMLPA